MKFISHRGNLFNNLSKQEENRPDKIEYCLQQGYDVEIDVWCMGKDEIFYLGHDEPVYQADSWFLKDNRLWCHAKNLKALENMLNLGIRCFWHEEDTCTLTSDGIIWTYPGKKLMTKSIAVMPEKARYSIEELKSCYGICSDNIEHYRRII